jgi:hypothetical protein
MFLLSYFFAGAHDLWVNLKEVVLSVLLFSEKSANPTWNLSGEEYVFCEKRNGVQEVFPKLLLSGRSQTHGRVLEGIKGLWRERERERESVCIQGSCFALGHFALSFMAGMMTSKSYVTRAKWIYNFQMWSCWVCKCVIAFVVIKCRIPCSCCRTSHTIRMNKWFLSSVSNMGSKLWGWPHWQNFLVQYSFSVCSMFAANLLC